MTDEAQIARLTALVLKNWPDARPDFAFLAASAKRYRIEVRALDDEGWDGAGVVLELVDHRAPAVLEAALLAINGDPPQWAVELAAQWHGDALAVHPVLFDCAEQLLAAAKGQP